jgi:RimJ/RimL family protein N-acetyltransferase
MIDTDRLLLRSWRDDDLAPFHAMNQDPEVIRHLADEPPSLDEARAQLDRFRGHERDRGHTFWAAERRDTGEFIGFCGLKPGPEGTPIAGLVEIGWRIARPHWRQGFAHEAAVACLAWAWSRSIDKVVAITVPDNAPSWSLMEKLGMVRDPQGDFDYPALPLGHRLSRHLTYRIARPVA